MNIRNCPCFPLITRIVQFYLALEGPEDKSCIKAHQGRANGGYKQQDADGLLRRGRVVYSNAVRGVISSVQQVWKNFNGHGDQQGRDGYRRTYKGKAECALFQLSRYVGDGQEHEQRENKEGCIAADPVAEVRNVQ